MSAGARGCQMLINPNDLGKAVEVKVQGISKKSGSMKRSASFGNLKSEK